MLKKVFGILVGVVAGLCSFGANAAIDITAATSGVLDAQVAMLAVLGALLTMSTVLLGVSMVQRFLGKKSGV